MKTALNIKEDDGAFIAGIGADKRFLNNKVFAFAQLGIEASILKLNKDSGSFRNTSLTAAVGLRYALDLSSTRQK